MLLMYSTNKNNDNFILIHNINATAVSPTISFTTPLTELPNNCLIKQRHVSLQGTLLDGKKTIIGGH